MSMIWPIGRTRTRWHLPVNNGTYARLAALWFGLQFVWGAVLAVSLQSRSSALAPADGLRAYALIAALGALVGTLAQLASGPLADRVFARCGNRRAFYAAGIVLAVPALGWFYLAPSYAQLVGAFFVLQIGMNVVGGPYAAIVPDYVPFERSGAASAWMGTLQSVGNAGGLLVAGFIANQGVVAGILAFGLVVAWLITARATQGLASDRAAREPFRVGHDFRTLVASRMAINFGFYTLLGFLFFFVEQSLGTPAADVRTRTALLFLTFTLANVAGAALGAKPADRYDKRAVVLAANAVVAVGLLLLAAAPNAAIAFAAAGIAGVAWGTYFIADWALACTVLPRGAMASAMSVWNIAATVPQIVAPALTTPIVERVNAALPGAGPRVAIALAIVEFTVGAVWLYRLPKGLRS
jgi:MFS family permease